MKNKTKTILLAAFALFTVTSFGQSSSPTPTPPAQPTASAMYTEVVPASSLAAFIASIPSTYTAADGTVLTLQGYWVRVLTGANAGKDAVMLNYKN